MTPVDVIRVCMLVLAWVFVLPIVWRNNEEFRSMFKGKVSYALAVFGLFAFVAFLASSCQPYAEAQAAERPECRDDALALILATCTAKIKATSNVTEKNRIRAACIADAEEWVDCK